MGNLFPVLTSTPEPKIDMTPGKPIKVKYILLNINHKSLRPFSGFNKLPIVLFDSKILLKFPILNIVGE